MNYIETITPNNRSWYTPLIQPYKEGLRKLNYVFFESQIESISLAGRVAYLTAGILFLIPVINTIIYLASYFLYPPENSLSTVENEQLKGLNIERQYLVAKLKNTPEQSLKRTKTYKKILALEEQAAFLIIKTPDAEIARHLRASQNRNPALLKMDGMITNAPQNAFHELEGAIFSQIPALSQQTGANMLCGYYALFFMLQTATGQSCTDRDKGHACLMDWVRTLSRKRTSMWLSNNRYQDIPSRLASQSNTFTVRGPCNGDMQYLIEHCDTLAPLREIKGFMLDLDEFLDPSPFCIDQATPFKGIGKAKTGDPLPEKGPLYIILKNTDGHYYFMHSADGNAFIFCHSMSSSVLNTFKERTFKHILNALKDYQKETSSSQSESDIGTPEHSLSRLESEDTSENSKTSSNESTSSENSSSMED
ncbi:MAG: hypothetical protein S4CHLAM123_05980 [Chlamydiales bacterium]|nr:hypothetical protein [Chlamydiales bacterium]